MILIGNQRSGGLDLANHLLKDENDHVMVHEVSGFACDDLHGAFKEAYAMSRGTKCKQFLFSLSLNPPADKDVSIEQFEEAIAQIENKLGLAGQPRAIVFHEKKGQDHAEGIGPERRHCHVVWSRIDAINLKAIPLPHSKRKLMDVSRDLYREHGWEADMPIGLTDRTKRDPRNFTLDEWQQAQRQDKDPRDIKRAIQDAWAISDNKYGFEAALDERGFLLARGKRAFVVVDMDGEVHSIPRALKIKTNDVRERLGPEDTLQSVETAQAKADQHQDTLLGRLREEVKLKQTEQKKQAKEERSHIIMKQRNERKAFFEKLETRRQNEAKAGAARFRKGLPGLWDLVRGENKRIRRENELDAKRCVKRDKQELQSFIKNQFEVRQAFTIAMLQGYQADMRIDNRKRHRLDIEECLTTKSPNLRIE